MQVPAAIPAPVCRRGVPSVVLRPVPTPLRPAAPVWTPHALLPLCREFHFMPVTMVAEALLPVLLLAIPSLWRPPVVHGLLILVLLPLPEALLWFE